MAFNKDGNWDKMEGQDLPPDALSTGMRQTSQPRRAPGSLQEGMRQGTTKRKPIEQGTILRTMKQGKAGGK